MSGDFHSIDGRFPVKPVAYGVVVEFVGLSGEVYAVLSESMVNFGELAPVSGLPCAC